jgi:hypothetical protein
MDNLILVYYIGTALIPEDKIAPYVTAILQKVKSESKIVGEIIVIPTKQIDTRIECINPKYITDEELIREHRLKMDELQEYLNHYINELKPKEEDGQQ